MSDTHINDIVDTLLLPFESDLQWNTNTAFLRAREAPALHKHDLNAIACEQSFKPHADKLERAGLQVKAEISGSFAVVLVLPPRQRDEARALLARALRLTAPGGLIVSCQHNQEGGRTMESDLTKLTGPVSTLNKHRCRVCWTKVTPGSINQDLVEQWIALDAPKPIADGRFVSRPGLFAWDRIDAGSQLLAKHLTADLQGAAADLGAGFGYLSAEVLARCPRITSIDLYEAEARALTLAKQNLSALSSRATLNYRWHDVTAGLSHSYDVIVTNPPFHTSSREDRPDIGRSFIRVAADALRPRGHLWLVANRHLPYEAILNERFGRIRQVASEHGYKIIEAIKND
jgi:16S rRNA (guanine1207-N2)-methyltransferase